LCPSLLNSEKSDNCLPISFLPHTQTRNKSNMKIKNKGKVHPSPSSSSSSFSSSSAIPYPSNGDFLSVLNLLPAAILVLTSVLSIQDREVLAYMITRSMNTTSPSSFIQTSRKKSSNKNNHTTHNTPCFDCGCFDCYTSYWFRWDSSPNREFIHLAIEAFEDHLTNGEIPKKNSSKGKKKERMARRTANNLAHVSPQKDISAAGGSGDFDGESS
ncbi:ATP-dependent tryptophan/phenylalanine/tyrosine adenylase, partial [Quillaja saponaria]